MNKAAQELGRKGGLATLKKIGVEAMKKNARKGGKSLQKIYGENYFKDMARAREEKRAEKKRALARLKK